ncbi:MAG: hypothetical protein HFE35_00375 [Clostridia bacterium]|uniref:hypothetical protein n=1 Tax=Pumilibacter muris TaxID=2941510 RepID=UPI002040E8B0|nr:hypothetical protein [Pumilibacter muris]MCI8595259.1 hypothetical protein [Clostridia bacterium]
MLARMKKSIIRFALAVVLFLSVFSATACYKENLLLRLVVTDSLGNEIEMVEEGRNVVLCLTYGCRDEYLSFTGKFYYRDGRKVLSGNLGSVFERVSLREPGKHLIKHAVKIKEADDYLRGEFELLINVVDCY